MPARFYMVSNQGNVRVETPLPGVDVTITPDSLLMEQRDVLVILPSTSHRVVQPPRVGERDLQEHMRLPLGFEPGQMIGTIDRIFALLAKTEMPTIQRRHAVQRHHPLLLIAIHQTLINRQPQTRRHREQQSDKAPATLSTPLLILNNKRYSADH